jgi:hypothetical protein
VWVKDLSGLVAAVLHLPDRITSSQAEPVNEGRRAEQQSVVKVARAVKHLTVNKPMLCRRNGRPQLIFIAVVGKGSRRS